MNNELPHIERPKANSLWRQRQSKEFDLYKNSSTLSTVPVQFWSTNKSVYSNCNFSIYSQQKCNASCTFCVEELRPASRGCELKDHKKIEENLDHYLYALDQSLNCVSELRPSISITGGEPSKDPNIHKIFSCIGKGRSHKLSMTSNASGLLDIQNNKTVLDAFLEIMPQHLNISLAHYDREENSYLMRYKEGLNNSQLRQVVEKSHNKNCRVRLSCALLKGHIDSIKEIKNYLHYAKSLGVKDVIFRQLMQTDAITHLENYVVKYSELKRVYMKELLEQLELETSFRYVKSIMGYYYYVEVWKYEDMNVVFEAADLSQLEKMKTKYPDTIFELIFHPNAKLCSTWQSWDGILGPQ